MICEKTPPGFNCQESINMQLGKKLNPSHPTVFVSVFLIEDVIQQPETTILKSTLGYKF